MKPLSSAKTTVERLDDGRLRFAIVHEVLAGITPAMLVWWFEHMDGFLVLGGREVPRYRVWHPRDHVALTYVRPGRDGKKFSAGAKIRIQELFGADPRYAVDVVDEVDFLDESGFAHAHRVAGVTVAAMTYRFTNVAGGTLYENSLTVGIPRSHLGARAFNRLVRPVVFPEHMGRAWLRHNVEEVGNFQFFLPELFAREARDGR